MTNHKMVVPNESASQQQNEALYHNVSPKIISGVRVVGLLTTLMIIIAFVCCLATGVNNNNLYLLACNILISGFVGLVTAWWYRAGDLSVEKYWFILLVCGVIMFQCLTTNIFVFNAPVYNVPTTTTIQPTTNTTTATTTPSLQLS